MRNPLSKTITGIAPSGIRKFFDVVSEMPDAISLGVGEPDFDTPWRIREEGIYSLEKGKTFYTSNAGLKELKIEICNYLAKKYDCKYNFKNEVLVTVGGSEGIDIALRAMLDPGDEVLIPQPSYVSYLPCTILANGTPVTIIKQRTKPIERDITNTDLGQQLLLLATQNGTNYLEITSNLAPTLTVKYLTHS